ncbi:MAG: rRNA maturation RNase YbeY [Chlamydiae bacterium]|nr:Endoribonuclease YbeY [Chlamydiales bacterium]MCH9704135.1 rRNA maturation RNase YbeY [Chlamydiota bacterium]
MTQVLLFDQQADLSIDPQSLQAVVKEALALLKSTPDEISIHFVETSEICRLHEDFFNDPTTTDCITFPMDSDRSLGYQILGEVFVCPKTAIDYGGDPYTETTLYVVHGILHLLGYDDIEEADRNVMRQMEQKVMDHLSQLKICLNRGS